MKADKQKGDKNNKEMRSLTDNCRACSLSLGVCREEVWHVEGRGIIIQPTGGM